MASAPGTPGQSGSRGRVLDIGIELGAALPIAVGLNMAVRSCQKLKSGDEWALDGNEGVALG